MMKAEQESTHQPTSLFKGPGIVYILMAVIFGLCIEPGMPLIQIATHADEQDLFGYALFTILVSYFILSIITTFTHREWSRQHWYINVIIFVLTGFILTMTYVLK